MNVNINTTKDKWVQQKHKPKHQDLQSLQTLPLPLCLLEVPEILNMEGDTTYLN